MNVSDFNMDTIIFINLIWSGESAAVYLEGRSNAPSNAV